MIEILLLLSLNSDKNDSGECFLKSRRECFLNQPGLITTTSPTTTKNATTLLPTLLGGDLLESGSTSIIPNRGA